MDGQQWATRNLALEIQGSNDSPVICWQRDLYKSLALLNLQLALLNLQFS